MPVTFENDNDIIVYSLECVIAHARRTQQIFVAQCAWWLASIIGLEQELLSQIARFKGQKDTKSSEQVPREVSATPTELTEAGRVVQVLDSTGQFLKESRRLREILALKTSGTTTTGWINPLKKSKKSLRKAKGISKDAVMNNQKDHSRTEGIDGSEILRRKAADECLRRAWPFDRKGDHQVKHCHQPIKLDKGKAIFPKDRNYQKPIESSGGSDPAESSDLEDNID